jgi:ferrochelatase
MADGCRYEPQLREACQLVADELRCTDWALVYQSRSGPPSQPWLEPDVCDYLRGAREREGLSSVVLAPIGFVSDHIEVLFDLDTAAADVCRELGIAMQRAATVGTHPQFIEALCQLVLERLQPGHPRLALGSHGPSHDICPADCCLIAPR